MKESTAVICLSRTNGGMELASVKLANLLCNDTTMHFIGRTESFIEKHKNELFTEDSVSTHFINFKQNFSPILIQKLRNIFLRYHIKNIIFLGASEMKSLCFATWGLNINFIVRQGTTKKTPKKDWLHRLQYLGVKHFVGNSEHIKQNILKILPIPKTSQVHKIYASVNLPLKVHFKSTTQPLHIIHLGRITKGKGQFEAIEACRVLQEKNIKFTLTFLGDIQDKNYYEVLQKHLQTLPYKDCIEFLGYSSQINHHLENSDIFLFPTYGEGMSNAIIEALGFGLIPILYNNTSIPEFKHLGFHVHLTKEDSIEQLQYLLNKVICNIEQEKKEAQKNHQLALDIFSKNTEKEAYLKLLI